MRTEEESSVEDEVMGSMWRKMKVGVGDGGILQVVATSQRAWDLRNPKLYALGSWFSLLKVDDGQRQHADKAHTTHSSSAYVYNFYSILE